jgi:integrase
MGVQPRWANIEQEGSTGHEHATGTDDRSAGAQTRARRGKHPPTPRWPLGGLDHAWPHGQRQTRSAKVYGETRREVRQALAELRRKADLGMRADASKERQTVATFMDAWLEGAYTSIRPQTWAGYRQIVRSHVVPALGQRKLSTLRPDAIQRLYAAKLAEGLAPSTVTKIHTVLHRALATAVRWHYLARNPTDDVDRPAAPRRDGRILEPDELRSLIERATQEGDRAGRSPVQARAAKQWAALWLLAVHSGCRESELLGLSWSDVDLETRVLTVRRILVTVKHHTPTFGDPK